MMYAKELGEALLKLAQNYPGGDGIKVVVYQQDKNREVSISGIREIAVVNKQTGQIIPYLEILCQ